MTYSSGYPEKFRIQHWCIWKCDLQNHSQQNGCDFVDHIFKCIFLKENCCLSIEMSLKFGPKGPLNWQYVTKGPADGLALNRCQPITWINKDLCQKQVSQAWISNCIPQNTVGCNYLSLPVIPASGTIVLKSATQASVCQIKNTNWFWAVTIAELNYSHEPDKTFYISDKYHNWFFQLHNSLKRMLPKLFVSVVSH